MQSESTSSFCCSSSLDADAFFTPFLHTKLALNQLTLVVINGLGYLLCLKQSLDFWWSTMFNLMIEVILLKHSLLPVNAN